MIGVALRCLPILASLVLPNCRQGSPPVMVDTASDGTPADRESACPSLSADGSYVAFASRATNLSPDCTDEKWHIYVHDTAGGTQCAGYAPDTGQPLVAGRAVLSADGRFVACSANGVLYVSEWWTGATEQVADRAGAICAISGDGRLVAYDRAFEGVLVYDREARSPVLVSVTTDGTPADGPSAAPDISADGTAVAFKSAATNLVPNDTNGLPDIFVRTLPSGPTVRVSVASDGSQQGHSYGHVTTMADASHPVLSATGRYVAFQSPSPGLVPDDANNSMDVFVHDRETRQTTRVSVATGGVELARGGFLGCISGDGRYVAFQSDDKAIQPNPTYTPVQLLVHDRETGQTSLASMTPTGATNRSAAASSMGADGRRIAFALAAGMVVPNSSEYRSEVFVRDLWETE